MTKENELERKVVSIESFPCRGVRLGDLISPNKYYIISAKQPPVYALMLICENGETEIRCPRCDKDGDFCKFPLEENEEDYTAVCPYSSKYD